MARLSLNVVAVALVASCGPGSSPKTVSATPTPERAQWYEGWAPNQTPSLTIGQLPQPNTLYAVVVHEFLRQGWKTVCLTVVSDQKSGAVADPPSGIPFGLKSDALAFRPGSSCHQDGEEVVDKVRGSKDAVAVTLAGADRDGQDYLVRVYWCCWTGWGTLRMAVGPTGWWLKGTEGWVQT